MLYTPSAAEAGSPYVRRPAVCPVDLTILDDQRNALRVGDTGVRNVLHTSPVEVGLHHGMGVCIRPVELAGNDVNRQPCACGQGKPQLALGGAIVICKHHVPGVAISPQEPAILRVCHQALGAAYGEREGDYHIHAACAIQSSAFQAGLSEQCQPCFLRPVDLIVLPVHCQRFCIVGCVHQFHLASSVHLRPPNALHAAVGPEDPPATPVHRNGLRVACAVYNIGHRP